MRVLLPKYVSAVAQINVSTFRSALTNISCISCCRGSFAEASHNHHGFPSTKTKIPARGRLEECHTYYAIVAGSPPLLRCTSSTVRTTLNRPAVAAHSHPIVKNTYSGSNPGTCFCFEVRVVSATHGRYSCLRSVMCLGAAVLSMYVVRVGGVPCTCDSTAFIYFVMKMLLIGQAIKEVLSLS